MKLRLINQWGWGMALMAAAAWAQSPAPRSHSATTFVEKGGTYLGVGVADIDPEHAAALNLKQDHGAEVTSVTPDGPAAKAGVRPGDVVLDFNGQPVQRIESLQRMVRELPAGRSVKIGLWRNGAPLTVTATLLERKAVVIEIPDDWGPMMGMAVPPMPPMPPIDVPHFVITTQSGMLGIEGEALGQEPQFADFFGVKDGILVKAVHRNSAAEKAGIKVGDVIVSVGDQRINSSHDLSSALHNARTKRTVSVIVVRNKRELPITVPVDDPTGQNSLPGLLQSNG
jgi:serine protease Do